MENEISESKFDVARVTIMSAIESNLDYFKNISLDDYAKWTSLVNQVASRLRRGNVPLNYVFLRNEERGKDGVLYQGNSDCIVVDLSFDDSGRILSKSVAVYERITEFCCPDFKLVPFDASLIEVPSNFLNESYNWNMSQFMAPDGFMFMSNYPNVKGFTGSFENNPNFVVFKNAYDDRCHLIDEMVAVYVRTPN